MSDELNKLNENETDSDDDNEDCDYAPENEVLSANSDSGSDSQEEFEDINGKQFRKKGLKRKRKLEDNEEDEEVNCKVNNQLTEEQEKEKADSLWAEFCKDMPIVSKPIITETINNTNSLTSNTNSTLNNDKSADNSNSNPNKKVLISKTYDFAGESVTVTEESEANSSDANNEKKLNVNDKGKEAIVKSVSRSGGLGGILDKIKKPKITTLQKSVIDWNNFKKDEGIEDELTQHNKSKNTFIERQAFLQRTDLRQFEIEKEVRAKNRSQRQLSKN